MVCDGWWGADPTDPNASIVVEVLLTLRVLGVGVTQSWIVVVGLVRSGTISTPKLMFDVEHLFFDIHIYRSVSTRIS